MKFPIENRVAFWNAISSFVPSRNIDPFKIHNYWTHKFKNEHGLHVSMKNGCMDAIVFKEERQHTIMT